MDNEVWANNKETPFVKGDVWATNPYITMRTVNGNIKYYLTWENKTNPDLNYSKSHLQALNQLKSAGIGTDIANKIIGTISDKFWDMVNIKSE